MNRSLFQPLFLILVTESVLCFPRQLSLQLLESESLSDELKISNRCPFTVWPALHSNFGSELIANGGFELQAFTSRVFSVSKHWSGTIWGRAGCKFSEDGCSFHCATGDCGQGLCCKNATGNPPISLAQIAFASLSSPTNDNGTELFDQYSVNLVQGYNLHLQIRPISGKFTKRTNRKFDCNLAGCFKDLNTVCPEQLSYRNRRSGIVDGCVNPCLKYRSKNSSNYLTTSASKFWNSTNHRISDYENCVVNVTSVDFLIMVQEHCPDVTVFEHETCGGESQSCRKNLEGHSALEVIFCP